MLAVLLLTALTILACVGIHWEGLVLTCRLVDRIDPPHRVRIAASIIGALIAHLIEIAVFAVALEFAVAAGVGTLDPPQQGFEDYIYFSATVYSSLGFGEIIPHGPLRQLVGVEALTGLVLIAWTASFSYMEMEQFWGEDD